MAPVLFFLLGGAAALVAPRVYKDSLKLAVSAKHKTISAVDRIKEDLEDANARVIAERGSKPGPYETENSTSHRPHARS